MEGSMVLTSGLSWTFLTFPKISLNQEAETSLKLIVNTKIRIATRTIAFLFTIFYFYQGFLII